MFDEDEAVLSNLILYTGQKCAVPGQGHVLHGQVFQDYADAAHVHMSQAVLVHLHGQPVVFRSSRLFFV